MQKSWEELDEVTTERFIPSPRRNRWLPSKLKKKNDRTGEDVEHCSVKKNK